MFEGFDFLAFTDYFKTEADCKAYLTKLKYKDGFECRHCGNTTWYKTDDPYVRRCNRCKKKDSATAGTLFHKCKFSLRKAFIIAFEMSCTKKSLSSHVISSRYSLRQDTAHSFMQKVRKAMESSLQHPLTGNVEVDEYVVGGPETDKPGRSHGNKKQVVMAIKHDNYGIHQCYARVIDNAGTKELQPFFEDHIDPSANVRTDKWKGYSPLKKEYPNLLQENSDNGQNFQFMHRQIMMFKSWLRGIHHRCEHLQAYLNEYCYRFNRLKRPKRMFHNLIVRMVNHRPFTQEQVRMNWNL